MAEPASAFTVTDARLRLTKSPSAAIAEAARRAKEDAGLDAADFIVVAVPAGSGEATRRAVEEAAALADPNAGPARPTRAGL